MKIMKMTSMVVSSFVCGLGLLIGLFALWGRADPERAIALLGIGLAILAFIQAMQTFASLLE